MSARDILITEIQRAPERVVSEVFEEVMSFLREKGSQNVVPVNTTPPQLPDFMGRMRKVFGEATIPDSQPIFDDLREDLF